MTWRSYTVRLRDARTGWDIFDITLLRPQGWMAEHSRQVAGRSEVWVDFEELHARKKDARHLVVAVTPFLLTFRHHETRSNA